MSLPPDLKPLYAQWLEEFISGLNPRQDQLASTYDKAKRNLLESESVIYYPQDLKKIKGIGDTIMRRLEKRLKEYCGEMGYEVPVRLAAIDLQGSLKRTTTALRSKSVEDTENTEENGPVRKKRRKYIPKRRSGGYSILLALLQANAITRGISKDSIIEIAQRYCDSSMGPNFMTKELRGAWSAVKSLMKNELVVEQGRPKIYFLTEEGQQLAQTLKLADNIIFENESPEAPEGVNKNRDVDSEVTADLKELVGTKGGDIVSGSEDRTSSLINITFQDPDATPVNKQSKISRSQTLAISTPVSRTSRRGAQHVNPQKRSRIAEQLLKRRFDGISYELWPEGSYEVYPIIDHREVKSHQNRDFFAKALELKGTKCEIRQLALGDIIWIAKHRETGAECILNTIIERKRLDDLAISIRDNRFMEQKNRLEKSGCKNKYYLIEETMARTMEGMTEALKTALWVILVYYRFSMIRTVNADETVEKLYALHTVISREYLEKNLVVIYPNSLRNQDDFLIVLDKFRSEFEKDHSIECCHTYQCFQEILGKGEMNTVGELTIRILMYINGISIEKAVAIQSHFPTLNHILTAYSNCETEEEAKLLMFTKLGDAPGTKKITKGMSEKIADVFGTF